MVEKFKTYKRSIRLAASLLLLLSAGCSNPTPLPAKEATLDSARFVTELANLDKAILIDITNAQAPLKQAIELGYDYFCQRNSCTAEELKRLKITYFLHDEDEYVQTEKALIECSDEQPDMLAMARVERLSRDTYYNKDRILEGLYNKKTNSREKTGTPAKDAFEDAYHEAGHARATKRKILPNGQTTPFSKSDENNPPNSFVVGTLSYFYTPDKNLDGKRCYKGYRGLLEETIVEWEKKRAIRALGLKPSSTTYDPLVYKFEFLLDSYFEGEAGGVRFFQYQQKSEFNNIAGNIGVRLGAPRESAIAYGDEFLRQNFDKLP